MDQVIGDVHPSAQSVERPRVEHVAPVDLGTRLLEVAGAGGVSDQAPHLDAVCQERVRKPPAHESGGSRDERFHPR